jgi:hypothetical protein
LQLNEELSDLISSENHDFDFYLEKLLLLNSRDQENHVASLSLRICRLE